MEYGYTAEQRHEGDAILQLNPDPLYKSYMDSLGPYDQINTRGNTGCWR